ncbi:putative E3 ubiquitin-protein ligase UBR7 isoform X2 [Simochromis diagramma]|uniref:putative E3 ubiquitin-protein ligase UBR7 isoform X2 n=1 Tax=Simochromis diagramma TaxID=43689 RepID=UPI001A7E9E26|nr:putative E3 ubiquitin-protein ligase UBR7 isoform X2 [Simochromis diagramma]
MSHLMVLAPPPVLVSLYLSCLCLQVEDEMIQCVVCEDWLHGRHLGCVVPDCVELQEMICESCMKTHSFLWTYASHLAVPGGAAEVKEETAKEPTIPIKEEEIDDAIEPSCKRSREEVEPRCRLKELQLRLLEAGLSFLLDESDTVLAYENKGKNSEQRRQEDDPLMSALDNLNHVQQLEIIHGYNDMKTELKDFLQRFAAEGKVVTSDDIRQFFEQQSRKRRRVDAGEFYCT